MEEKQSSSARCRTESIIERLQAENNKMSVTVTILGSTGSIGVSALRVLESLGGRYSVMGLSCCSNLELFEKQIARFRPAVAAVGSSGLAGSQKFRDIKKKFPNTEFLAGEEGIYELACRKTEILISAIVGAAGLKPTISALPYVRRIALANKETLVMAGGIFMQSLKEHSVELLPVDSEHSAIFSLLQGINRNDFRRVIITASGGSLRDRSIDELDHITPEQALAHPTWTMGNKITIDSATLMNKGLEVIECHHLFDIDYDSIDVIIHPESIIHSMIETTDGAIHAYMSKPDMAHPILNALTYPEKVDNEFARLDLLSTGKLTFSGLDSRKYPALELCYAAGRTGGTMPAVLNAANEVAVYAFLNKVIPYKKIVKLVEKILILHSPVSNPRLSDIFDADKWAREEIKRMIKD